MASGVPSGIAWLYPVILDGLALVAYAATHHLRGAGAVYAWSVVVVAAGLSGLAQATYLASGPALDTSPILRFGVGAWPAAAGAVAAHLVYLLSARHPEGIAETGASDDLLPGRVGPPPVPAGPATPPAEEPAPAWETVGDLVARTRNDDRETPARDNTGDRAGDDREQAGETPPTRFALTLAPTPPATPPSGTPAVGEVGDTPIERAGELIAAGAGRRRLSRELGVSEHEARRLLASHSGGAQ